MGILLDSSVIVEAERRRMSMASIVTLSPPDETLSIAALTISELLLGVHLGEPATTRNEREFFIENVLRELTVLNFDEEVARVYAEIWAGLRRSGNIIPPHDLMIGATALHYGFEVLTHNLRHFSRIPGLHVREPGW